MNKDNHGNDIEIDDMKAVITTVALGLVCSYMAFYTALVVFITKAPAASDDIVDVEVDSTDVEVENDTAE